MTDIDFDARYTVNGSSGIAFFLRGYVTEQLECQGHPADWDTPMGETFFCDSTCEEPSENRSLVRAVMVGDDREHIVDVDDLTVIEDNEYCSCCGQIGCPWGEGGSA